MKTTTEGLILKETAVRESDRLVVVLTKDLGLIRAFVRNAKSIKNRNFSSTGLFCFSSITLNKKNDAYTIDEAVSNEIFFGIREDVERFSLAQYFAEVLLAVTREGEECGEILKLALNCLYCLSRGTKSHLQVKTVFEMRLMSVLGYMPNLVACCRCAEFEKDIMYFDAQNAVIFCEGCRPDNATLLPMSNSALSAFRHIVYSDANKIFAFSVSDETLKLMNAISERYVFYVTDQRFKTLQFYHSLEV